MNDGRRCSFPKNGTLKRCRRKVKFSWLIRVHIPYLSEHVIYACIHHTNIFCRRSVR